jgi:hypothetical protein
MKEKAMHQNQSVAHHPQRQRRIDFGEKSLWPRFPESCRLECQRRITQLLVEVIHKEREQEGGADERQD